MRRYLDANPGAGLDDLAYVVGNLSALGGRQHLAALEALRAVSETATKQPDLVA